MEELKPWIEEYWHIFINKLPPSQLHYVDELANAIINSLVAVLLVAALLVVKKQKYQLHKKLMMAALVLMRVTM